MALVALVALVTLPALVALVTLPALVAVAARSQAQVRSWPKAAGQALRQATARARWRQRG